jgi:hypothetical protein
METTFLQKINSYFNLHEENEGTRLLLWISCNILRQMDEYSSPGNRVAQPSSNEFSSQEV